MTRTTSSAIDGQRGSAGEYHADPDVNRVAQIAKALSHPIRIAILQMLARLDVCMCGDLVDRLPLAQSTVSQHLRVLRSAGLIKGNIEPPRTCYCIDWITLEEAGGALQALFSELLSSSNNNATNPGSDENQFRNTSQGSCSCGL